MQLRITNQIVNIHIPTLKALLKNVAVNSIYDMKNALGYQIATISRILTYYGSASPLKEFTAYVAANVAASIASTDYVSTTAPDSLFDEGLDASLSTLYGNISNIYQQAPKDIRTAKCPSTFVTRLDALTYSYQTQITNAVYAQIANFTTTTNKDRTTKTSAISAYHLSLYYCSIKSLAESQTCVVDLVKAT